MLESFHSKVRVRENEWLLLRSRLNVKVAVSLELNDISTHVPLSPNGSQYNLEIPT